METENPEASLNKSPDAYMRSCSKCIYWHDSQCRYGPPMGGEVDNWPVTSADAWCFRWRGTEATVREPKISNDTILAYIKMSGDILVPGTDEFKQQGWAYRYDVINYLAMEKSVSKQALMSRLRTMAKYNIIGMGLNPPGAPEQDKICVWKIDQPKQKTEVPESYVESLPPGRPRLYTADLIVNFLSQKYTSPANRIGIRPLHRAISVKTPISLSTCIRLVEEGVKAGVIERWETGYWAPAKKTETDSSDLGTIDIDP